jgi:hypothetical protein
MDVCGEASEGAIARIAVFLSLSLPSSKAPQSKESKEEEEVINEKALHSIHFVSPSSMHSFRPAASLPLPASDIIHSLCPPSASTSFTTASYASAPHVLFSCSTRRIASRSAADAQLAAE